MNDVELALNAVQFRAFEAALSGNVTVCNPWGRGGGKSQNQRFLWYTLVARWDGHRRLGAPHTGVRIVLLMPTLEQAKKVHATLMIAELSAGGDWAWLGAKIDRSTWKVTFPGGSWIQWVTAERANNIAGLRCDVISVDECDDIDPEVYDAMTLPWFSEHHSLRISVLSGTPRRGRYGLLYRTYARALGKVLTDDGQRFPNHFAEHASCYDFPEFVSSIAIERARLETRPELFRREWMCDFDAAEGLVYSHFDESFHVREPVPNTRFHYFIVGADWGYEDPACFAVFGVAGSGRDITIHLLEEVYVQHKTDSELSAYAQRIELAYPRAKWYGDPSRPQTIRSLRDEAGINIRAADNAIDDGVATVADLLLIRERKDGALYAQLYVSPDCVNTQREFGLYRRKRDPRNRERVLDDIEDKNNHAMDAVRYALHTHFGRASGRIIEGQ